MSKKIQEISQEQLAVLNAGFPTPDTSGRVSLPRFGMLAKDIVEEEGSGKNKKITVVQAAGTFYTEKDLGEVDDYGKKKWTKTFIDGESVDLIIAFHRRQLRLFDQSLNKFISSPIFDSADQVIPLYLDKRVIARGTAEQLRALYPKLTQKGKKSSALNDEQILFVLYEGELYQANISQSSKWGFKDYSKALNPSTVVTTLSSVEETNGSNTYRKMTFKSSRMINTEEFEMVQNAQGNLKETVESDKQYFLSQATKQIEGAPDNGDKELDDMVNEAKKHL